MRACMRNFVMTLHQSAGLFCLYIAGGGAVHSCTLVQVCVHVHVYFLFVRACGHAPCVAMWRTWPLKAEIPTHPAAGLLHAHADRECGQLSNCNNCGV